VGEGDWDGVEGVGKSEMSGGGGGAPSTAMSFLCAKPALAQRDVWSKPPRILYM
jgi:hypothetical protein